MLEQKKLIVSHAPFWHNGNRVTERSYHTILAALPAVLAGLFYFGSPVSELLRPVCRCNSYSLGIAHQLGDRNSRLPSAMAMPP